MSLGHRRVLELEGSILVALVGLVVAGQSSKERPRSTVFGHQGSPDHHSTISESAHWTPGFHNVVEDAPDGANLRAGQSQEVPPSSRHAHET